MYWKFQGVWYKIINGVPKILRSEISSSKNCLLKISSKISPTKLRIVIFILSKIYALTKFVPKISGMNEISEGFNRKDQISDSYISIMEISKIKFLVENNYRFQIFR